MKYLSICSGIEAASCAWHPLGWKPVGFSEIEAFPAAVLKHHYPEVPNLGDMTKFKEWQVNAFDVLVGGTPCQAFSVAGLRQSLDDARGNLSLIFCEMADHFDPPYILWENVPGVLNTKDNAFGCFLAGLAGEDAPLVAPGGKWSNAGFVLGPKRNVAWRVLDAQYFGLAQRRRRAFVVACPRSGADPCEILFEREGVQRHSPPSREKGERVAPNIRAGAPNGSPSYGRRSGDTRDELIGPVCGGGPENGQIAGTVSRKRANGSGGPAGDECYNMVACVTGSTARTLRADGFNASEDGTGRGTPIVAFNWNAQASQLPGVGRDTDVNDGLTRSQQGAVAFEPRFARNGRGGPEEIVPPLKAQSCMTGKGDSAPCVAFHQNQRAEVTLNDTAGSLKVGGKPGQGYPAVQTGMQVRRLTPTECERLQGFPDGYTAIPWRKGKLDAFITGEDCPDGPRYKALGNSMAVPCLRWIGERIQRVSSR